MTNGISETVPAEEFREFKRPVVLAPNPYNPTRASHNVRKKYWDTGDATSGAATRRRNRAPGLAQAPPARAGRVERPVGVGGPGGGSLRCGASLGTQLARPYPPHVRPLYPAAGGTG